MGTLFRTDVIAEEGVQMQSSKHYEGVFAQGSGHLHIRGSFEEGLKAADQNEEYMRLPANVTIEKPRHPRSICGTYVPGITGSHPLLREELVNLPNPLAFYVAADGEDLDMDESRISGYVRQLDLNRALLSREFIWETKSGGRLSCSYRRYVSMDCRNLIVQKMRYRLEEGSLLLSMRGTVDEKVKTNGYNHFTHVEKQALDGLVCVYLKTDTGDEVRLAALTVSPQAEFAPKADMSAAEVRLAKGQEAEVIRLSMVSTSRDPEGLLSLEAIRKRLQAAVSRQEELWEDHCRAWKRLWDMSRVTIEGDEKAQLAVNFSVYHLLRSCNDRDDRIAVCAKGFAGEAYFGHYFWDTEVYLLPFFLYTRPEAAKMLERFRIRALEGAKKNAAAYGYAGARYPWESGLTGEEQCPNWQYGDHEVHITADVAFGLWHYLCATKDEEFLEQAAPVFVETARYWLERSYEGEDGCVHINGVMGPDEYVCLCSDNAYTNYMVRQSLLHTVRIVEMLQEKNPEAVKALGADEAFLLKLQSTADRLTIRRRDNKVILQCAEFEQLEEPDFDRLWPDKTKAFGSFVSQERNYRTKALKQADVLMLFYLFPKAFDREALEENYRYYLPYTTHDSSLSCIIHSILCCLRGKPEEACEFFERALDIDLDETKGGAAEGIHIANCGGIWQAVIFGFCGMSRAYETDVLAFAPVLPKSWRAVRFPVCFKGGMHQVEITHEKVCIDGMPTGGYRIGLTDQEEL